jgi:hypothetical protein
MKPVQDESVIPRDMAWSTAYKARERMMILGYTLYSMEITVGRLITLRGSRPEDKASEGYDVVGIAQCRLSEI